MFQPVGSSATIKVNSSNKTISRFFVDSFFLPWCQNSCLKKRYDSDALIEAINNEIKRLDLLKVGNRKGRGRSRTSSTIASNEAKCVARICKYTGINTSNKNAVGVCTKCALFEHFDCSKTSSEDRDEILKGSLQYIYTLCFLKNPSQVTVIPEAINREKISSVCKAIEGPSTSSEHMWSDRSGGCDI